MILTHGKHIKTQRREYKGKLLPTEMAHAHVKILVHVDDIEMIVRPDACLDGIRMGKLDCPCLFDCVNDYVECEECICRVESLHLLKELLNEKVWLVLTKL